MDQPAAAAVPPSATSQKWYQGLDRYCWIVLIISALGWLFDTMDQNLYNLVRAPSLKQLLHPHPENPVLTDAEKATLANEVKFKGYIVTAIFIVGWATGGWIFGILGDRLGRTKTMIYTILIYAVFTGMSGLVGIWGIPRSWILYSVMRFMTGLGVGGEWAAGAALVAEVFPARSKTMALGLLQSLSAVGNMMASVVTLCLGDLDLRWRWAYFVGFLPALLIVWIRRSVKEPEAWLHAKQKASLGQEMGNIGQIFTHPVLRRNTIAAVMMAAAGGIALWGAGFFSTDILREELQKGGNLDSAAIGQRVSIMFLLQNAGSFFGIYLFAAFSERTSRKAAFYLWWVLAWGSLLAFFWGINGSGAQAYTRALILAPIMGFCMLGPFSGYTIYFPYLYPTRLRTTGCGFCYNVARYIVAAGIIALGGFGVKMGGFAVSATIVSFVYIFGFIGTWLGPETKGRLLPEDKDFETEPAKATA
jgi:MFS family permease